MPNHLREKPTLSIWLQICGWLGMIGILFTPQIGALLYLEHREPNVNQAELTGLELVYNISIKNFLFPDALGQSPAPKRATHATPKEFYLRHH